LQGEHSDRHEAAGHQGRQQSQPRGDSRFLAACPDLTYLQLDPRDPDEEHHRPRSDAGEELDDRLVEDELMDRGEPRPENARAEKDATDDLNDDEGGVVLGLPQPPDQVRDHEDRGHREEEGFCDAHGPKGGDLLEAKSGSGKLSETG
jgi:hypothetical protein